MKTKIIALSAAAVVMATAPAVYCSVRDRLEQGARSGDCSKWGSKKGEPGAFQLPPGHKIGITRCNPREGPAKTPSPGAFERRSRSDDCGASTRPTTGSRHKAIRVLKSRGRLKSMH
jgi:hypothetical protein